MERATIEECNQPSEKLELENLKKVLDIPLVEGYFSSENLHSIHNEKIFITAFEKIFSLLAIKDKKLIKKGHSIEEIKQAGLFILQKINKWYTTSIVNIISKKDNGRDVQILYYLDVIQYLTKTHPYQLSFSLVTLIQDVGQLIYNPRKKIVKKAIKVTKKLIGCCGNKDIQPFAPVLLDALQNLDNIPDSIQQLAGCIFVQKIEFRALAVMIPILRRGLNTNITEIKRKCCVIINNMCKLVEDPKEIYPLVSILSPLIKNCSENMSDPEAREVASKTLQSLEEAVGETKFVNKTTIEIKTLIMNKIKELELLLSIFK